MSVTDQQLLDAARESLLRILATDTEEWSESKRMQRQLSIDKLMNQIDRLEEKVSASQGRRIFQPVRRVNV